MGNIKSERMRLTGCFYMQGTQIGINKVVEDKRIEVGAIYLLETTWCTLTLLYNVPVPSS